MRRERERSGAGEEERGNKGRKGEGQDGDNTMEG